MGVQDLLEDCTNGVTIGPTDPALQGGAFLGGHPTTVPATANEQKNYWGYK